VEKAEAEHTDIEPSDPGDLQGWTVRIAEIIGTRIGSKNLVILQDITERKRAERRLSGKVSAPGSGGRLAEVEETGGAPGPGAARPGVPEPHRPESHPDPAPDPDARKTAAKLLGGWPGRGLLEQIGNHTDVMPSCGPDADDYGLLRRLHWYGADFDKTASAWTPGQEAVPR